MEREPYTADELEAFAEDVVQWKLGPLAVTRGDVVAAMLPVILRALADLVRRGECECPCHKSDSLQREWHADAGWRCGCR